MYLEKRISNHHGQSRKEKDNKMARILIVDDEQENLNALKRALNDENPDWEILTASSEEKGEKALEDQLRKKEPVDVVLTDLVMDTEASGMNILIKARRLDPLVMAILFTQKKKVWTDILLSITAHSMSLKKNIRGAAASKEINIKDPCRIAVQRMVSANKFLAQILRPESVRCNRT